MPDECIFQDWRYTDPTDWPQYPGLAWLRSHIESVEYYAAQAYSQSQANYNAINTTLYTRLKNTVGHSTYCQIKSVIYLLSYVIESFYRFSGVDISGFSDWDNGVVITVTLVIDGNNQTFSIVPEWSTSVSGVSSIFTLVSDSYSASQPRNSYSIVFKYCIKSPPSSVSQITDDTTGALQSLVSWFNGQFNLGDLVKGEPYSLPESKAELAANAIVGGLASFGVSQIIPLGTFGMQLLEQYQIQKLNYTQDVQFQLIIAMFKTLVAGLWPKGDMSELLASFSGLDTGLEYRAKVNDHWLNQSLTRALNSFTDETEFPLDTPSLEKVIAEKTDLVGVQYGNFKKVWPFQAASNDIFYTSEELKIVPWPKQLFFIQE